MSILLSILCIGFLQVRSMSAPWSGASDMPERERGKERAVVPGPFAAAIVGAKH